MTRKTRVRASTVVGHTGAILWSVLAIIPFALIILLAFKSNTDIYTDPLGLFNVKWHPQNFVDAWKGAPGGQGFAVYLLNSAIVTTVAITGCLLIGAFTAYFATLATPRVRMMVVRLFLVATTLPLIMLLIPYYTAFNALDLLGSPWALGVLYIALCLPTCVLILHSFYLGFPSELAEAAAIDGLGRIQTFVKIVLPLSKGPIVSVGMINAFFVWGETQLAIVLLQAPGSRTIPVGLLDFKGQFASNTGAIFAGLTLATIPLIIVYLVFNRTITKGVALGGVFR
ncbi:ABC-type glycerol-3-phosphate transport system permease component [Arthrobacter pascens]|uniref:carbohydrate ABC transporter permease n=1 Tax=Arthrobacter pascens TaxID=1677 RepID=UPI00277E24A8|nr:carbohydrate ABC transporter permease [Arthrobacter pascens]MDQ0634373.1 ABC-type glycerol-3-phosphate transport system permease component [Arthrobacter pascens]